MARSEWAPRRPALQTPAEEEANYASRVARTRKHLRLPAQKLRKWEVWCTVNRIDFQELVEAAVDFYLDACANPTHELDAQAPSIRLDDLDRLTTPSSSRSSTGRPGAGTADEEEKHFLRFYALATGNRVKETDKAVYKASFANLEPYQARLAIVMGLMRAKMRINSLRYFEQIAEEVVEQQFSCDYLTFLEESVRARPMYSELLGAEKRQQLLQAFASQPALPGMAADVLPFNEGETNGK